MTEADRAARAELFAWMDSHKSWGDDWGGGRCTYGALSLLRRLLEEARAERDRALRVVEAARLTMLALAPLWGDDKPSAVEMLEGALTAFDKGSSE